MGEYEFTSEEKSKDFENQPPGISLNEIIQTGLDNFLNGNYKKKAVVSSTSNIDNVIIISKIYFSLDKSIGPCK